MTTRKCKRCGKPDERGGPTCAHCGSPFAAALTGASNQETTIKRGQIIANRYIVQEVIGKGGMGRIYKVHDNTLDEVVALKTLLPEYVSDSLVVERFFNEARIARQLSHPNIVRVHDIGQMDGLVYISMELLPGRSLRAMLEKVKSGHRLPVNATLRIFDALCAALEYAHRYTIHRDIKPENVMILPDGTVKLMDFGISKLMSNPNLTSASIVMGTPHYMPPEQLKNSAGVDARADIYSVGVMLYEVLTGHTPTGVPRAASEAVQQVPQALDPIIRKCLEPEPKNRYRTVSELRTALREVRENIESSPDMRRAVSPTPLPFPGSSWTESLAGAMLLLLIVAVAAGGLIWAENARRVVGATGPELAIAGADAAVAEDPAELFEEMSAVVQRAKTAASETVTGHSDPPVQTYFDELLSEGDALWAGAAQWAVEGDHAQALDAGWNALHYYLAITLWPEGMVYIPRGESYATDALGGQTITKVDAFFIDAREATMETFASFSQANDWRWPAAAPTVTAGSPMADVAFYDAQAFLASRDPGKKLPTDAQWMRAMHYANDAGALQIWSPDSVPLDEDDSPVNRLWSCEGYYEWTRTNSVEVGDTSEVPEFGSKVIVMGSDWERTDAPGNYNDRIRYEDALPSVAFRGVYELPRTIAAAERLLD